MWLRCVFAVLAAVNIIGGNRLSCRAFIWHIGEHVLPDEMLTFTERHMFSTKNGPQMMEQGVAFIDVEADLQYTSLINGTQRAGLGFFAVKDGFERETDDVDVCNERFPPGADEWLYMSNVAHFQGKYSHTTIIPYLNTTAYVWNIHIHRKLPITQEAWHNVAVTLCPSVYSGQILSGRLEGTVAFRNPYGYIPGEMYGMLPFEGARAVGMLCLFCLFLFFYVAHVDARLPLHTGIVIVLLIALVEFSVWFGAYILINESGLPYCCPFPKEVVAALILQVFRQTLSRVLLLVVSLGYGIVRPRLLPVEVYSISGMAIAYFIASIVASVAQILLFQKQVNLRQESTSKAYGFPQFILDVLFLSWIYISLTSTIRILSEFRQTAKLDLYNRLHRAIIGFVAVFSFITVLAVAAESGLMAWPWEYMWLMDVLWQSLNFGVLAAVALICLPTETSRLLTYASQLPTSDDDDGFDIEGMDQFALMMAEDDELEAMDEATHGSRGLGLGMDSGGDVEMVRSIPRGGGAGSQAEKHRRIVEAAKAKRRKQQGEQYQGDHYSLPDSLDDDVDDIDDIFHDDDDDRI